MPVFNGCQVRVSDVLEALGTSKLPEDSHLKEGAWVELDIEIDQSDVDAKSSEPDFEYLPIDEGDLREGLRYLAAGDRTLAAILLARALEHDPAALRVIDEELRFSGALKAA